MFNQKIIEEALKSLEGKRLDLAYEHFKAYQSNAEHIKTYKEEKYQEGFLRHIFVQCLGYTLDTDDGVNFNLTREQKNVNDGKKADGAIFVEGEIRGVIELKDTKTKNLSDVEAQAFGYKVSHKNVRYVITSNFAKLRFYIDDRTESIEFELFSMDRSEFDRLYLLLHFEGIRADLPLALKNKSLTFEQDISFKLYQDYKAFRLNLFENLCENNPQYSQSSLLNAANKLCDRFIFIVFAEDKGLIPAQTVADLINSHASHNARGFGAKEPLYEYFKRLFIAIDEGSPNNNIKRFNGGLFREDPFLDSLRIDDRALDLNTIASYNFTSDVSVNILGHIFENSLNDLEELNAKIEGRNFNLKEGKRKTQGIYYTPEFITRYIVNETLGALCADKKRELGLNLDTKIVAKNYKKLTRAEQEIREKIYAYRDWLLELKILDPACGSGAFLNQALEFLISEHAALDEFRRGLENEWLELYDTLPKILENNLYGVDINADAIEIAKLSLWLRTAKKGETLTDLSKNLIAADSLLNFPFDFTFDVIIGNPPYVKLGHIKETSDTLEHAGFETFSRNGDLYVLFVEQGFKLLNSGGGGADCLHHAQQVASDRLWQGAAAIFPNQKSRETHRFWRCADFWRGDHLPVHFHRAKWGIAAPSQDCHAGERLQRREL